MADGMSSPSFGEFIISNTKKAGQQVAGAAKPFGQAAVGQFGVQQKPKTSPPPQKSGTFDIKNIAPSAPKIPANDFSGGMKGLDAFDDLFGGEINKPKVNPFGPPQIDPAQQQQQLQEISEKEKTKTDQSLMKLRQELHGIQTKDVMEAGKNKKNETETVQQRLERLDREEAQEEGKKEQEEAKLAPMQEMGANKKRMAGMGKGKKSGFQLMWGKIKNRFRGGKEAKMGGGVG